MQCAFAVAEVRKVTANLSQTCGFAVAELSVNLRCPALQTGILSIPVVSILKFRSRISVRVRLKLA